MTQNSASQIEVEVLADITDANEIYEESLANLRDRKPIPEEMRGGSAYDREQAARDYYASVRTNVSVAVWLCMWRRLMRCAEGPVVLGVVKRTLITT